MFRRLCTLTVNAAACVAFMPLMANRRGAGALGSRLSFCSASGGDSGLHLIPLPKLDSYVNATTAQAIDIELMQTPGFSIDQLMELAGLSVASAVSDYAHNHVSLSDDKRICLICGPGNNGGDGLVAARHLKHFGFKPSVVYPKKSKSSFQLFDNLVKQCNDLGIPVLSAAEIQEDSQFLDQFDVVVDAMFGFSFSGRAREPFYSIIEALKKSSVPVLSVDLPSGWNVDEGDLHDTGFLPQAVISLTVPKKCMSSYDGVHYVGGRFVPPSVQQQFKLELPYYYDTNQVAKYDTPAAALATSLNQKTRVVENINDQGISMVYVTAETEGEAKTIAQGLLAAKLAACVNVVPKVISHYEWEGKLEESTEVMMIIKTPTKMVEAVTQKVKELHSYDVPEVIASKIEGGSHDYIDWVLQSTKKD